MKASFSPRTKMDRCCDPAQSRYALGNVAVSPTGEGVWLVATDGRVLAAVHETGEAVEPMACPMAALKAAGPKRSIKPPTVYRENGHWIDRKSTMHPADDEPGRFPRVDEVMPKASEGAIVLRIDAQLLANLAAAINDPSAAAAANESPTIVALILPAPGECGQIDGAIAVNGNAGFGVIMPAAGRDYEKASVRKAEIETYEAQRKRFAAEFKPFGVPNS